MKIRPIIWCFLGGLLMASCQSEVDEFTPDYTVPIPRGNILNFYEQLPQQSDTIFSLTGMTGAAVQLRSQTGVLIEIPDQAWMTADGKVVEDEYSLAWKEIRVIADQVERQISMQHYQGMVRSDKAFQLRAEKEGEALVLTKDILIRWPSASGGNPTMWKGIRPTPWVFRWQDAPQSQISLTNWIDPVNGAGVNGFLLSIAASGTWCAGESVVLYPADPEIQVKMPKGFAESNTAVYWLDVPTGTAVALEYMGGGVYQIEDIPTGKTGRLFCVTEAVQNNFYSAWIDLSITAGGYTWNPIPEKRSLGLVRQMLESL
ncbi:MAG: hypothetical protein K9I85_14365 [Saprospiraceae bacterium]|nr:hypothetical protein [Saprospiraceae bacterium]